MPDPRLERIRATLPSLWRPEEPAEAAEGSLLFRWLRSASRELGRVHAESSAVMQAHWLDTADRGLLSPYLHRRRQLEGKPVPAAADPEVTGFPYVADLARLGSLLGWLPWPGELVEAYRTRLRRLVALYRNGLGTPGALRQVVAALLPVEERPFLVEEWAPVPQPARLAVPRGARAPEVGPLARWTLENGGIRPAAPTVYVEGIEPDGATRPLVELFAAGDPPAGERVRLGIAYDGTVPAGQTLRLRTAHASWLGTADGLRRALSMPGETAPASPAAAGPWGALPGAPEGRVTALAVAPDGALWAAVEAGGAGTLWRFDGATWTEAVTGLPAVSCLALDGGDLLAGTDGGVMRLPLFPEDGGLTPRPEPAALAGPAVHALLRDRSGVWWVGTAEGLARLGAGDALEPAGIADGVAVHAIHQDSFGTLWFGTGLGLVQLHPETGRRFWYSGAERSDQLPEWEAGDPDPARIFLPAVHAILRGPDAALWLGTAHGIARYGARSVGGLTYTTLLEAFPALATGRVAAIAEDPRGAVWFATEQGLFRYDGQNWWQGRAEGDTVAPVRLESGEEEDAGPVFWRFDRDGDAWERLAPGSVAWTAPQAVAAAAAETAVHTLLWTDQAVADLGSWDGETGLFTPDVDAETAALRMRYKPDDTRIVDGGIPALPRLPEGSSVWRYLSLESGEEQLPVSRPAWTVEGRLLPPPPDRPAAEEGRWSAAEPGLDLSAFDRAVFAYPPAARLWFAWEERRPLSVAVRLPRLRPGEEIDPGVLDRVWQGIEQVRPAGARVLLTVDEDIVRGV
jgi:hypothetical protein